MHPEELQKLSMTLKIWILHLMWLNKQQSYLYTPQNTTPLDVLACQPQKNMISRKNSQNQEQKTQEKNMKP